MDLSRLADPFHSSKIHWRVGATNVTKDGTLRWGDSPKAIPLAYLNSRDIMKRLDKVCRPENWQSKHEWSDGKIVQCSIGIRIGIDYLAPTNPDYRKSDDWVWKSDGAGETQIDAEKGAMSGAIKRAAVSWGIGRYLYELDLGWFALESVKKKQFSKETQTLINKAYENWLISDEGPLKSLVERQEILSNHLDSVSAVKAGIASQSLSEASEEWFTLSEEVQSALLFAPSRGGVFSTKEIEVMRSTEFRQAYYPDNE